MSSAGRPSNDCLALVAHTLSGCERFQCVSDGIFLSNCRNISLAEYVLYSRTSVIRAAWDQQVPVCVKMPITLNTVLKKQTTEIFHLLAFQ